MRDETWLAAFDDELRARGLPAGERAEVVVELEGFLVDSGTSALEQFGPPAAYADALAAATRAAAGARRGPSPVPVPASPHEPPHRDDVLLEAHSLGKAYRGEAVLAGVDLDVRRGELVALVGANGAGKSTLLRLLAGFERPDAGRVARRCRVGYVPQAGGLDPQLRPHEHFELFGAARGRPRRVARREGERLARELGWAAAGAPVAAKLSGGTRQKLGVVTAMVAEPDTLLLDEPDQGLDAESTRRLWGLLRSWCEGARAVVVASHGRDALTWAHRVVEVAPPGPGERAP